MTWRVMWERQLGKYRIGMDDDFGYSVRGLYDEHLQSVLIDDRMSDTQKRCTLIHEMCHWLHADEKCNGIYGGKTEHRAQTETAQFMVNQYQYAQAKKQYEGDTFLIANELDVTMQVLSDYRKNLRAKKTIPIGVNLHALQKPDQHAQLINQLRAAVKQMEQGGARLR